MKNVTRIFSLVVVLVLAFSVATYAAEFAHEFTITSSATSAKAGDTVTITIDLTGPMANVAMVQYGIKFDSDKFSVNANTDRTTGYKCYDSDWYAPLKADAIGSGDTTTLGYINTPSCGLNPADQLNVAIISTDGYYIDDASALYTASAATAGKIKFTAIADVDTIDSSTFELVNAKVDDNNSKHSSVTVNQIAAAGPSVNKVATTDTVATVASEDLGDGKVTANHKGSAVGLKFAKGDVDYTKMIWSLTVGGAKKFSKPMVIDTTAIEAGSDVVLAATFLNGAKLDGIESVTIDGVNAIFSDGTNDYFTDETDADLAAK